MRGNDNHEDERDSMKTRLFCHPTRWAIPVAKLQLPSSTMIHQLTADDAVAYFAIRQEMLRDSPSAFGSSPSDDRFASVEVVQQRFADRQSPSMTFGRFDDEKLVGVVSAYANTRIKQRHVAGIGGMYVQPSVRGRGIGRALLDAIMHQIAADWPQIDVIAISVSDDNLVAKNLYESVGFESWGHEPSAVRLADGCEVGHIHMSKRLLSR